MGDLLEVQVLWLARKGGRDHSLGQIPIRAVNGLRQCILACALEGVGLQAITRCYRKNGSSAQIDVENLGYTKLNSFLCVFFAQNKSSKWATWKFESENVITLA